MTNLSDRLPALAGIASKIARRTNQKYYAGIWSWFIIPGLAWYSCYDSGLSDLSFYRAPSWSWLSVEGAVHISADKSAWEIAIVIDINTETDPIAPFGSVSGGHVTIKSVGIPVVMYLNEALTTTDKRPRSSGFLFLIEISGDFFVLHARFDTIGRFTRCQNVIILPLMYLRQSREYWPSEFICLVLSATGDGRYRRVGLSYSFVEKFHDLEALQLLRSGAKSFKEICSESSAFSGPDKGAQMFRDHLKSLPKQIVTIV